MTFTSFDFRPELLKSLAELGYETPTPIQAQTIPLLLEGHDVIGCAQTGTGKTAAFALPILEQLEPGLPGPQALIITPTRELAEQIDQNIKAYTRYLKKIVCLAVYGGVNISPQELRLRKGVDIVVATPGRLLDHLQRKTLNLSHVEYLVLDEADRMLDMGFLPDIKRILKQVPEDRQTLLFSATMPNEIKDLVASLTHNAKSVNVSPKSTTADSVEQCVYRVDKPNKLRLLIHLLENHRMDSVIVFSRTRHGADRIARQLGKSGLTVARIHADRSQNQRQQALDGFKQGKFQVLVATDIAARGIDVENISHVINFDTPTHAEDYVHRIGRTGRAAASGDAFTFTCAEEDKYLKAIEKLIGRTLPVADERAYRSLIQSSGEVAPAARQQAGQAAKAPRQAQSQTARPGKKDSQQLPKPSQDKTPARRQAKPQGRAAGQEARPVETKAAPVSRAKPLAPNRQAPRQASERTGVRFESRSDNRQQQPYASSPTPRTGNNQAQGRDGRTAFDRNARSQESNRQPGNRPQASTRQPASNRPQDGGRPQNSNRPQNNRAQDGYVARSAGGSLRVVRRSKGSIPLSGEVDYIDLDDEQPKNSSHGHAEGHDRQPQNIDANAWGYPRNPVYEPWKNKGGQSGQGNGPRRPGSGGQSGQRGSGQRRR